MFYFYCFFRLCWSGRIVPPPPPFGPLRPAGSACRYCKISIQLNKIIKTEYLYFFSLQSLSFIFRWLEPLSLGPRLPRLYSEPDAGQGADHQGPGPGRQEHAEQSLRWSFLARRALSARTGLQYLACRMMGNE